MKRKYNVIDPITGKPLDGTAYKIWIRTMSLDYDDLDELADEFVHKKETKSRGFPAMASGEFDKDLFTALKEKYLPKPRPESSELVWTCKDKRKIPICEMDTKHVVNTIRMIEDGRHSGIKEGDPLHQALRKDLAWRRKIVTKFSKKKDQKKRSPGGIFFKEEEK